MRAVAGMPTNRMAALVACMFVASLTQGQLYAFAVYGGALKDSLELTQDDLDTIATFPYISGFFVWLPGRSMPLVPVSCSRSPSPAAHSRTPAAKPERR